MLTSNKHLETWDILVFELCFSREGSVIRFMNKVFLFVFIYCDIFSWDSNNNNTHGLTIAYVCTVLDQYYELHYLLITSKLHNYWVFFFFLPSGKLKLKPLYLLFKTYYLCAGKKLAESLVREKLAACVNRVPGMRFSLILSLCLYIAWAAKFTVACSHDITELFC